MPLKTSGLEHVYVFKRQTMDQPTLSYDYMCRSCLTKLKDVKMVFFEREDRLWVRCPECGVEEKVSDDSARDRPCRFNDCTDRGPTCETCRHRFQTKGEKKWD